MVTRRPQTGNADCDKWIADTFRRLPAVLDGRNVQSLVIKNLNGKSETILNDDQLHGLIYWLRTTFCKACDGTGFDPDTLNGNCEYCSELPY